MIRTVLYSMESLSGQDMREGLQTTVIRSSAEQRYVYTEDVPTETKSPLAF